MSEPLVNFGPKADYWLSESDPRQRDIQSDLQKDNDKDNDKDKEKNNDKVTM